MSQDTNPAFSDALFLGASGLVGGLALRALLHSMESGSAHVFAPARRLLGWSHPQLRTIVADLGEVAAANQVETRIRGALSTGSRAARSEGGLALFICCLGTTLRVAGSRDAFAAVDRDLVVRIAQVARRLGAEHAIVVSSVGADAHSRNFYLRIKGEMEEGVAALGFERADFLRPGLLLGSRSERRTGERIAQSLAWLYNPLLAGPLQRYRAIDAARVADAIVALARCGQAGSFVHDNAAIAALASA